jgi:hypothetical protein
VARPQNSSKPGGTHRSLIRTLLSHFNGLIVSFTSFTHALTSHCFTQIPHHLLFGSEHNDSWKEPQKQVTLATTPHSLSHLALSASWTPSTTPLGRSSSGHILRNPEQAPLPYYLPTLVRVLLYVILVFVCCLRLFSVDCCLHRVALNATLFICTTWAHKLHIILPIYASDVYQPLTISSKLRMLHRPPIDSVISVPVRCTANLMPSSMTPKCWAPF